MGQVHNTEHNPLVNVMLRAIARFALDRNRPCQGDGQAEIDAAFGLLTRDWPVRPLCLPLRRRQRRGQQTAGLSFHTEAGTAARPLRPMVGDTLLRIETVRSESTLVDAVLETRGQPPPGPKNATGGSPNNPPNGAHGRR